MRILGPLLTIIVFFVITGILYFAYLFGGNK